LFRKVQLQFRATTAYGVTELVRERLYEVRRKSEEKNMEFFKDTYTVAVDEEKKMFECSCKKMRRDGIQCCHVLKIAERLDLILVPDNFLRHRWTIEASHDLRLAIGQDLIIGGTKSSDAIQYCIIMANISNFVSTIAGDRIAVNLCSKEFDELKKENNTGGMDRELPCRSTHGGWRRSCWGATLDAAGGFASYKESTLHDKKSCLEVGINSNFHRWCLIFLVNLLKNKSNIFFILPL
jgi:hypothetical protein